jgi:ABC-type transport system involved in multi-copper enzyme maturation permease subunit
MIVWVKPLWVVAVGVVAVAALLYGLWRVADFLMPKVTAIARTTAKEGLSQPLFYVILAVGIFLILLIFPFLSYGSLGEDIKMLKSSGLELIKILALILAVWTAGVSIFEEIEGRTALTLLSKPIGRRQLILGKFLGVIIPVAILFVVLGALFLCTVSYKVVYDARETSQQEPESQQCYDEMVQVSPGLALAFMEAVVLASVSVAISTRLPTAPNLIICFTVYLLGHLVPILVKSAVGEFAVVGFVSDLLAAVLPVLGPFSIETAISTGQSVPLAYLGMTAVAAFLYCTLAMLLALLLFEDRDLA